MFEYDKAINNFQESLYYAETVKAESLKAFALKGLAKVFYIQENYNEAIKLLNQSKLVSANINDLILNKEIYEGLSENYLELNQWDLFEENKRLLSTTQDLINESERNSIESTLVNKKVEMKTDFSNEVDQLYVIIILLFILIIISIVVFLFVRQKTLKELDELKMEISNLQNEKLSDVSNVD